MYPGNLNNQIKTKNNFHYFISNLIIWKSFTILPYFGIFLFLISLKIPEDKIIFKLFSFQNDIEWCQMAPVVTDLLFFSASINS